MKTKIPGKAPAVARTATFAAAATFGVMAALAATAPTSPAAAQNARVDAALATVQDTIIRLREHIHQNPELGNREFNTAALVADHLRALGFDEVHTGIAHTGVVGILRGGRPGPVVIDLPKDILMGTGEYQGPDSFVHRSYRPAVKADRDAVAEAVALMAGAKRPLLLSLIHIS
jgi:hypothetical protein